MKNFDIDKVYIGVESHLTTIADEMSVEGQKYEDFISEEEEKINFKKLVINIVLILFFVLGNFLIYSVDSQVFQKASDLISFKLNNDSSPKINNNISKICNNKNKIIDYSNKKNISNKPFEEEISLLCDKYDNIISEEKTSQPIYEKSYPQFLILYNFLLIGLYLITTLYFIIKLKIKGDRKHKLLMKRYKSIKGDYSSLMTLRKIISKLESNKQHNSDNIFSMNALEPLMSHIKPFDHDKYYHKLPYFRTTLCYKMFNDVFNHEWGEIDDIVKNTIENIKKYVLTIKYITRTNVIVAGEDFQNIIDILRLMVVYKYYNISREEIPMSDVSSRNILERFNENIESLSSIEQYNKATIVNTPAFIRSKSYFNKIITLMDEQLKSDNAVTRVLGWFFVTLVFLFILTSIFFKILGFTFDEGMLVGTIATAGALALGLHNFRYKARTD